MLWTAIAQTQRIDRGFAWACQASPQMTSQGRSEEHTSELQSQSNLVCRLLLEKKKQTVELESQAMVASGCARSVTCIVTFSVVRSAERISWLDRTSIAGWFTSPITG